MKKGIIKYISAIAAAAAAAVFIGTSAYAEDIAIMVDGRVIECAQPPVLQNDTTLVPIRAVSENLGCTVEWNEAEQSVYVHNDTTGFVMYIGSTYVNAGGTGVTIPQAPEIIGGSTMVPIRAVSELLGSSVGWDDYTETVIISSYGDLSPDISDALSDDERYMLNIFLSNFSEINFGYFDADSPSRDQLVYFGCFHNAANRTSSTTHISDAEAEKYTILDPEYIHSCYKVTESGVFDAVLRYFGICVEHGTAAYTTNYFTWHMGYANKSYYFDFGEEGDSSYTYSVANYMKPLGDGTYEVHFNTAWEFMVFDDSVYYRTPSEQPYTTGQGVAIVRPLVYNGKNTYQLLKYSWESV